MKKSVASQLTSLLWRTGRLIKMRGGDDANNNEGINKMTSSGSVKLKRHLSLHHGVAVIVGLVVGSGIYIAPKGVLVGAGSPGLSLVIWLVCCLSGALGAMSFAELGTTFQASGERYVYLEEVFGPFTAFVYLWMYLLMFRCGANATKVLTFAHYVLQPWTENRGDCSYENHALISLLASSLACKYLPVLRGGSEGGGYGAGRAAEVFLLSKKNV